VDDPTLDRVLREIKRRADAEGVPVRDYLAALIRRLDAARRADVTERRRTRRPQ